VTRLASSVRIHAFAHTMAFALAVTALAGGVPLLRATLLAQGTGITVRDPWVREPLGDRRETAAFGVVSNPGTGARAIVGATSEAAGKVELHEMKRSGAMMRMSQVQRIEIPAGGSVELKPGGLHIMLFDLKQAAKAGDTIPITLTFDDGSTAVVSAAVRKAEGMR
jgi:copper(I)-binding protein